LYWSCLFVCVGMEYGSMVTFACAGWPQLQRNTGLVLGNNIDHGEVTVNDFVMEVRGCEVCGLIDDHCITREPPPQRRLFTVAAECPGAASSAGSLQPARCRSNCNINININSNINIKSNSNSNSNGCACTLCGSNTCPK
jgi:hypothetical protein